MSRPMLFGKYCLLERISVGGMAEVFRAKPLDVRSQGRFLALKRILPHLAEDDEFIKMFVDEAKVCVHLRHPNIVHIFELGTFQSSPYILMEFIPGQEVLAMQKRLRKRRLVMSIAQACYISMELAKGLEYAHAATDDAGRPLNIIHRDVSPQNVLVSYTGQVKLIDFGVAKAAVQSTKTQVGVLKGKFGYMSPEQIRGEAIDSRSDLFAAGIFLWELLTNRRLFTGDSEYDIFEKVRTVDVVPPSQKNPQVPAEVDRIVMRALSADPHQRYASGAEFAADLQRFLDSLHTRYTRQHLADWMQRFFSEEFTSEIDKVREFDTIRTAEDVRRITFGDQPSPEQAPAPQDDVAVDATQIWDADVAPQDIDDIEAFADNHTVVQAGGFDLDEFVSLHDDDIIEIEEIEEPDDTGPMRAQQEWPTPRQDASMFEDGPGPSDADTTMELQRLDSGMLRQSVVNRHTEDVTGPRQPVGARVVKEAKRRRNIRAGIALAAVVSCVALSGATLFSFLTSKDSTAPQPRDGASVAAQQRVRPGAIVVTSTPSHGLEVRVDGEVRADRTPLSLRDLSPGEHTIEVSHPRFETYRTTIELRPNGFVPIDVEFTPR